MNAKHHGLVVRSCNGLTAIHCLACGFVHLDPLPSQEELDAFYDGFYASGAHLLEQQPSQRWYWRRVYRERIDGFAQLVPRGRYLDSSVSWCMFDYGAGTGEFEKAWLSCPRERWPGLVITGYEPCARAREVSGLFGVMDHIPDLRYEAVHCSLVLEHVLDPAAVLANIFDRLVPGGVLCVVVPSEFNPLQRELVERRGYCPLTRVHPNYFTPQSLAALARRAGFEQFRFEATFPMEWFALVGLDYVRWPRLGRVAHFLRMAFEVALMTTWPSALRNLRQRWASKMLGREVALWARKPS